MHSTLRLMHCQEILKLWVLIFWPKLNSICSPTSSKCEVAYAWLHCRPCCYYMRGDIITLCESSSLMSMHGTDLFPLISRYSIVGDDDHGYSMLHRAIEMAKALGIINSPRLHLNQSHLSEDMMSSIKRTAWGLFQVDT